MFWDWQTDKNGDSTHWIGFRLHKVKTRIQIQKNCKKYDNLCNRNQKSLTNSYLLPNVLGFIWPLAPIGTALVPKKVILATIFVCRWVLGYWEQCTVWKDHRQAGAIIVQWTANYLPLSSAPMRVKKSDKYSTPPTLENCSSHQVWKIVPFVQLCLIVLI